LETEDRGGVISARGTGNGLVICLDGRVANESIKTALDEYVVSRKSFLSGNEVSLEWFGLEPEESFVKEISNSLCQKFDVSIKSSKFRTVASSVDDEAESVAPLSAVADDSDNEISLFGGIDALSKKGNDAVESRFSSNSNIWDDADTRLVYVTLRSGQKIETEHSMVIFGDVNSGAEVIAGGDVVVLGTLRGVAHAGAYDETGGGRVIFSLNLQATQLRIGMVISRGEASKGKGEAEIARVDGDTIVVEPYQSRLIAERHLTKK